MTFKPHPDDFVPLEFTQHVRSLPAPLVEWTPKYVIFKYICDKGSALLAMPFVLLVSIVLLVANPFFNPGPLFYSQDRMGMGGRRFKMWKFRSMSVAPEAARAHDALVEEHRITPFARLLRKFRIDELPNFYNVLVGDMSLVGPRPDAWDHSTHFVSNIVHYKHRFRVRPGITGLAQVYAGYADTVSATYRKARFDHFYVRKSRIKLDLWIIWRTVVVVLTGFGAR